MKIAVYRPENSPMSYTIIRQKVCAYLETQGADILYFSEPQSVPGNVDLVWDPNAGGGFIADIRREHTDKPIVATVHGARLFALPVGVLRNKNMSVLKILRFRFQQKRLWKKYMNDYAAIVPVSDYSADELHKYLNIPYRKIHRIYNAVDHAVFKPIEKPARNYFLHISEYQPVKNLDRTIKAYITAAAKADIPDFWIFSRNFPKKNIHPKIKVLNSRYRSDQEIAELYQNAYAFLFPSLHEGFGIPIIESMACGTPVITSDRTACPEVAGKAALTVSPKAEKEISQAILRLVSDKDIYYELVDSGLKMSADYSWSNVSQNYLNLFEYILERKSK
jgi:glycosyltransferase involved in cell wall biosynthesis